MGSTITAYKSKVVHGLMMLRNHRTGRHIIVFESDDWGSIRMPSLDALSRLESKGVVSDSVGHKYDLVDTLASNDDLELLMDVLSSVKDSNGNPAKITLNCVMANPDFGKIQESDFQQYYYEPFTETLKKYPHHDRSFELWKEGIRNSVFQPQFHGREHLNVQKWMRYLQSGNRDFRTGFEESSFSMGTLEDDRLQFVLQAFDIQNPSESEFVRESITEGLQMFEQMFGFKSKTLIAPCYTLDSFIEDEAYKHGVIGIQGSYIQGHSRYERAKGNKITGHYFGEKNHNGQVYTVRNCNFEPSQSSSNADSCMKEIKSAFMQRVPAVVSCHRLNFIGELNTYNRDNNLREFKRLLEIIVAQYPDVEFMSSDELITLYQ